MVHILYDKIAVKIAMNRLSVDILDGPWNNVGSQDQDSQDKEYRNTPFFTRLVLIHLNL